jgi:hypothetical protein
VELVLAAAITLIIGLAVAGMLLSVSTGTSSQREGRSLSVAHAAVAEHLGYAVRGSKMVLAKADGLLVLWIPGSSTKSVPTLSRLCRIECDAAAKELCCYRAPVNLPPADDTQYDLATTDFNAVTNALKGTASFPKRLWATDAAKWAVALDAADPKQARFVSYRLTLSVDGRSETSAGGAALRN